MSMIETWPLRVSNLPDRPYNRVDGLAGLVARLQEYEGDNLTLLEVGTWAGVSAAYFAHHLPNWKITTLDIKVRPGARHRLAAYPNVEIIASGSIGYLTKRDAPEYTGIYLDGDHSKRQIIQEIKAAKVSRFYSGHDYSGRHVGVVEAVYQTLGDPHAVFPDTSWFKEVVR